MPTTPTNVKQLVEKLVEYENIIKDLNRRNKALTNVATRARQQAVSMHTKSTKKSTFTNYEVKQMSKELLAALEQTPLIK
jgi:flagellar biosynthesis/type III secretory pathway chaperone